MKGLFITSFVSIFLGLTGGSLLDSDTVSAQDFNNEIGIYSDLSADPGSSSIMVAPNVPFDAFLIVTNPFNEEFAPPDCGTPIQRDIPLISAFQFRIIVPEVGLYVLAMTPNGSTAGHVGDPPDHGIPFSEPLPVPGNRVVMLMTFTFMVLDANPKEIYLEPTLTLSQNGLAIYDGSEITEVPCAEGNQFQIVHPVSGSFDRPVFGINTNVVAAGNESWGSLKALYR